MKKIPFNKIKDYKMCPYLVARYIATCWAQTG